MIGSIEYTCRGEGRYTSTVERIDFVIRDCVPVRKLKAESLFFLDYLVWSRANDGNAIVFQIVFLLMVFCGEFGQLPENVSLL